MEQTDDIRKAYNQWSEQYDTNLNKTRDLEGQALRQTLAPLNFESCLEIGCGTGKNTVWLLEKGVKVTGVDLSEAMLARAKAKTAGAASLVQADITGDWSFVKGKFDLVGFSLVLEHIQNLEDVLLKASTALTSGGWLYIGELHPFKQYSGSKARFEGENGTQVVECYLHHTSDFIHAARKAGLQLEMLEEYFDEGDKTGIPRILVLLLRKSSSNETNGLTSR